MISLSGDGAVKSLSSNFLSFRFGHRVVTKTASPCPSAHIPVDSAISSTVVRHRGRELTAQSHHSLFIQLFLSDSQKRLQPRASRSYVRSFLNLKSTVSVNADVPIYAWHLKNDRSSGEYFRWISRKVRQNCSGRNTHVDSTHRRLINSLKDRLLGFPGVAVIQVVCMF